MADSVRVRWNEADEEWDSERSEKGAFECYYREMSMALNPEPNVPVRAGKVPPARPFEVDLVRIPPGAKLCPRHAHSTQWEYYIVLSGRGQLLQAPGEPPIPMQPGDHLMQPPGWVHTVENDGEEDLLYYVVANNPVEDVVNYPDSGKWLAARHVFRMVEADYFDGEE